tara:strand:+ start:509 stop:1096 length:588 start_codon:yes stop_codon:yes gene_type:complete
MAHNPVGINSALPITNVESKRGVDTTPHKTDALRVVAVGASAHIAIGPNPTATTQNYYISAGESEVITLGACRNQTVVGIATVLIGAVTQTVVAFPEGTGSPFQIGDAVTLTVPNQNYWNFTHKLVTGLSTSTNPSGFFNVRIIIDNDYNVGVAHTALVATNFAELRGSFKVAALGTRPGTLHYQQVQSSKGANG